MCVCVCVCVCIVLKVICILVGRMLCSNKWCIGIGMENEE